jgi:cholesterol transport system auxiliary component
MNLPSSRLMRAFLVGAAVSALAACALPDKPTRPVLYDFGPGALEPRAQTRMAPLPPIALAEVEVAGLLDGSAVLYRLGYADAHQLRPYANARWSASPAVLLRARLRDALGERRTVFNLEEGASQARVGGLTPRVLRIELEEFSHYFDGPAQSRGVVRLRATVLENTTAGEQLIAQRLVVASRPAPSDDAPGGVRALSAASDAAVADIGEWLQQLPPPVAR